MKISLLSLLIAFAWGQSMFAQTETFDIATFVRPAGWSRAESNGILVLQDRKRVQGRVEFCQIYLFPSQSSKADATENFQAEWDSKVARTFGIDAKPSPQAQTNPEGWTAVSATGFVVWQGVPTEVVLVASTGFGRSASILVTLSPNTYQTELNTFFQNFDYHAPGGDHPLDVHGMHGEPPSSPAGGSLANYVYTPPPSWSQQTLVDGVVLRSPVYDNGESCQLTLLPWRPSSQPLDVEAIGTFRQIFQTDPLTTYPSPPPTMARGTSPQGWEYFTIKKLVGGQEGEARTRGSILLVARVDSQVATIVGTSKDFMVSQCFGLLRGDVWPRFFYSLQFKNARSPGQELAAIQQRLAGSWILATGSMGMAYTFQANGRYADTMATQYRTRVSGSEVLATTTGFFGDGAYSIDGNRMVMKRDDGKRFEYLFRVEQVSKDSGRTWADRLTLMEPGGTGEFSLRRN